MSLTGATIKIHDFRRPMAERAKQRKVCGPYQWTVGAPGDRRDGVGFYMASGRGGLRMDRHGASLRLRVSEAPETRRGVTGYYGDEFGDTVFTPIIARLPRGRGFLAGWTMGAGMCATLSIDIHDTEEEAGHAAHGEAERAAEAEREYQEREAERFAAEEAEEARLDNLAACHPLQIPAETEV